MPRRHQNRHVCITPQFRYYKPQGVSMRSLEEVELTVEECESLRLADLEGVYQDAAAESMGISRATFGRVVAKAREKIAQALFFGKAIRIAQESHFVMKEKGIKIAVASNGKSLCDEVSTRFAQAPYFLLIDPETKEFSVLDNSCIDERGMGVKATERLLASGVRAVIAGRFGSNVERILINAGVATSCDQGSIEEVIAHFKNENSSHT